MDVENASPGAEPQTRARLRCGREARRQGHGTVTGGTRTGADGLYHFYLKTGKMTG